MRVARNSTEIIVLHLVSPSLPPVTLTLPLLQCLATVKLLRLDLFVPANIGYFTSLVTNVITFGVSVLKLTLLLYFSSMFPHNCA